jgi:hypothetical protein
MKDAMHLTKADAELLKRFRSPVAKMIVLRRLLKMEAEMIGKNTTQTACKNGKERV